MNNAQRLETQIVGTEFSLTIHKPTARIASDSIARWVVAIKASWAKGPASMLELARVVSTARNALPHGGWSALWKKPCEMPFSKRHAYLLLTVHQGLGWANVHVCAHLPTALRTLSHLAKLDRTTLERLIEAGAVHPALKEAEARELVARFTGEQIEAKTPRAKILNWLRRCGQFVRAHGKDWQPEDRKLATDGLAQLIDLVGEEGRLAFRPDCGAFGRSTVQNAGAVAPRIFVSFASQTN